MSRRGLALIAVVAIVAIVGGPTLIDRTPLGDVDVDVDGVDLGITLPSIGASADPGGCPAHASCHARSCARA